MESTKNKGIYIELVSIEENKQLDCIYICNNQNIVIQLNGFTWGQNRQRE